jgi:FKBP-type peptidyl-prolyl cis-trans isomerase SlyD
MVMSEQKLHFISKPNYGRIRKDKVVRLRYALFDRDGEHALEFRDDLYYLHGGYGGAFPKIEAALEGMEIQGKTEVELDPEEGYGHHDPALRVTASLEAFPPEAHHLGARLEGEAPDGRVLSFRVVKMENGQLTVDGNHPLAGRRLRFVLEVLDIRDASAAEIAAGHAFAPSAEEARH